MVGGGKGCQPPRGQAGMGLRRGNERVLGGLAFKGGRRASLGIGARSSLESDGALGAASRGGHRRGLWVKGAGGGVAGAVGLSP